jgi:hypothetical protein
MTQKIGRTFSLGLAKEAVRGTAEAAATFWPAFTECAIEEKDVKIFDDSSYGIVEDAVGWAIVKQWAEGSIKGYVGDKSFPLLLLAALGTIASTDDADTDPTIKDHAITVSESAQHQSLTLFLDDVAAGVDYKHALACLTSLELKLELGKWIDFAAGFKAKKGASATLTPSMTAENRFHSSHVVFKTATNLAGLDAASAMSIRNLSLKIDKNLEDDDALGSASPVDFLNKQLVIEGTVEAVWKDETSFKTATLAGTAKAMRIDLKNTDVTIGAAANPEIKIDLAKVVFKEISRPIKINDVVTQSLSFKAVYSVADSKMIAVTCVNAQASY